METQRMAARDWRSASILLANLVGLVRLDLEAPLTTAWELANAWPGSELVIIENAAHSPENEGMARAIIDATNRFSEISSK